MAKIEVSVDPGAEMAAREARRHRSRLPGLTDTTAAALAARAAADPELERTLTPGQRIEIGLYEAAVESREWLREHDQHTKKETP